MMTPLRTTVVTALRLAARPAGLTAGELAEVAGCKVRWARQVLAELATDGVLTAEVPDRKGQKRGAWRTVYHLAVDDLRRRGRVEWKPLAG